MSETDEERLYQTIHRMVIWGEPREDVYRTLEENGYSGVRADALYRRAWKDRIATIRTESLRAAGIGLLALIASAAVLYGEWMGVRGRKSEIILCTFGIAFGLRKLTRGVFGFLLAQRREGSLADDDF